MFESSDSKASVAVKLNDTVSTWDCKSASNYLLITFGWILSESLELKKGWTIWNNNKIILICLSLLRGEEREDKAEKRIHMGPVEGLRNEKV